MEADTLGWENSALDGWSAPETTVWLAQTEHMPPSTRSSLPATKLLSSEARNSIAAAISSGRAMRPSGMFAACLARTAAASSGDLVSASISGVSQGPGVIVLTRMPRSWRRHRHCDLESLAGRRLY
jgi:hypothetical protein